LWPRLPLSFVLVNEIEGWAQHPINNNMEIEQIFEIKLILRTKTKKDQAITVDEIRLTVKDNLESSDITHTVSQVKAEQVYIQKRP
jgi:hypothetical protein